MWEGPSASAQIKGYNEIMGNNESFALSLTLAHAIELIFYVYTDGYFTDVRASFFRLSVSIEGQQLSRNPPSLQQ